MASSVPGKKSKEEWRRAKDLEAARKAGTVPAEVDEEGNEINPHIPQYMSQAPWYVDTGKASLKHQRAPGTHASPDLSVSDSWYARGKKVGVAAKRYRKGACENCGAITHKSKDCVERPRKKGARWTNRNIQPDEIVQDISLGYEGKRDRWNGYDPSTQAELIQEYDMVEEARKRKKAEELDKAQLQMSLDVAAKVSSKGSTAAAAASSSPITDPGADGYFGADGVDGSDDDEDKYAEGAGVSGQKFDAKTRITVRNLRIREDTAKYLMNLDTKSAHYDPKTRSMRGNPNLGNPNAVYQGDNALRVSGDTGAMGRLQGFAWNASSSPSSSSSLGGMEGGEVHLQANPTQSDQLYRSHLEKRAEKDKETKSSILAEYGGLEHLVEAPPPELLHSGTEHYVEYSRSGQVIRGKEGARPRSKYEEDVYPMNHSSVWGSWWQDGQWGYQCCKQFLRQAYCTSTSSRQGQED